MIRFYSSRELSRLLSIPLNRWKRWSREFLPPDPLGGLQSGYARQFSPSEAFSVYLGGFLVAGLGFSIPQARQVLKELNGWMKRKITDGHLIRHCSANGGEQPARQQYEIHILGRAVAPTGGNGILAYRIRKIEARRQVTDGHPPLWQETYTETSLKPATNTNADGYPPVRSLLDISALADRFACLLK